MYVVRTISQLKEAVRERAREVMVVGLLAPQMLALSSGAVRNDNCELSANISLANLFNNFNVLEVHDSSENVIAAVFQKRDEDRP